MENYDNTININFWTHSSNLPHSMNVILAAFNWNFDSTDVNLERQMNSVCSLIMRNENATLQDSNIIELTLSCNCNKQECQDVFSMKQNIFHLQSEA